VTNASAFDVLLTCPPMLGKIHGFNQFTAEPGIRLVPAKVTQTLSVLRRLDLVPGTPAGSSAPISPTARSSPLRRLR